MGNGRAPSLIVRPNRSRQLRAEADGSAVWARLEPLRQCRRRSPPQAGAKGAVVNQRYCAGLLHPNATGNIAACINPQQAVKPRMAEPGRIAQLVAGLRARRRRRLVRRLLAEVDIRELVWVPGPDSPLSFRATPVRLAMDYVIGPRTLAFGHWHDEHCALIRERLQPGYTYRLVDVGANAGLVSRQLLATPGLHFEGADCFEPDPHNFSLLQANLAPFAGVRLHAAAVSDVDGSAELFRGARNAGDVSLTPGAKLRAVDDLRSIAVPLVAAARVAHDILQSLLGEQSRLVWKSDTQGYDIKIVAAMPQAFWERVTVALIEVPSVAASASEIAHFMAVVESFPVRRSIKFAQQDVSPETVRRFIERGSGSELDLLLAR